MRISLSDREIAALSKLLEREECSVCRHILEKIHVEKQKPTHPNKIKAAEKARRSRAALTKKKVENAINLLRLYGEKIEYESIAREANVSMASAKKYAGSAVSS